MVLLTTTYVDKECSRAQSQKSLTKGLAKDHLQKITHLFMNDKLIDAIGDFSVCKNLKVIHLQNNSISRIENLNFAVNLTQLYLQHNELTKIENLDALRNLHCLFLGYNRINVIEGLENLHALYELHIPYQQLPTGESLIFDPRSLNTLSLRLKKLNIAGNNISSIKSLRYFQSLETLNASDNDINDMLDLTETVKTLRLLRALQLIENPVVRQYRFRENLIANSDSLVNLNGKEITYETRRFMKNFQHVKQLRLARNTRMTLSDDITSSLKLPPAFERSVSRAILQQQYRPSLTINTNSVAEDAKSQFYPPWKSATSIDGKRNSHFTPRPFWKTVCKTEVIQYTANIPDDHVLSALHMQSKKVSESLKKS